MPRVFSAQTLEKFEDAAASIPIRALDRAFASAQIRPGKDPGGAQGARKSQFRAYVATVDQRDPQQLDRLGAALGALVAEVATSKVAFLVTAAQRDGFSFADGVFTPAPAGASSFAITSAQELFSLDDRVTRLRLLANDDPADAIVGAMELVESVCRATLRDLGESTSGKAAEPAAVMTATLQALDRAGARRASPAIEDAKRRDDGIGRFPHQVATVVATIAGERKTASPRHARLAVGMAVAFAAFVAETYVDRVASNGGSRLQKRTAPRSRVRS